ncbi:2-hydroxyacid dehydrogenase [Aspergillus stella-maris]|uniref:2-hydroxyacid dehydrogenase n=1 Tax=Aspergillus stella-maris TaxID=1810926 RepID=UPI003CCCA0C3
MTTPTPPIKLAVFSTKSYDKTYLDTVLSTTHPSLFEPSYHPFALSLETVPLAANHEAISAFVNDTLDAPVLRALHSTGARAILLRCAGYNNIDLTVAEELGLFVANVPSYSPEAVAEFTIALLQTLNRNTHRAYNRVREGNFNLEGLMGTTLFGKTVGVIGVGRIGLAFAKIVRGFGCRLLAADPKPSSSEAEFEEQYGGKLVPLETLLSESDIVSLHCPLTKGTRHIIDTQNLALMKKGALLVNTSRGPLINTKSAIEALKSGQLGGLALDVYEEEAAYFYNDHSHEIIHDDTLMRLMTFPNVLVCGHQAFFTREALGEICETVARNLEDWVKGRHCVNSLVREGHLVVRGEGEPVRI